MQGIYQNGSSSETDGSPGEQQQKWMGWAPDEGLSKTPPRQVTARSWKKIRESCALTRCRETGFTQLILIENEILSSFPKQKDIDMSGRDKEREKDGDKDKI